jgi:hypothetical protein
MQHASSAGAATRKRKVPNGGCAAPSKVARCKDDAPVVDKGAPEMPGECTLSRIDRVVDWHARNDCLSELPTSSSFDTRTLLDSIPFCKMLASIRPAHQGVEIPLVTRVYEERFMRQCIGAHEKPCCMDNQCECMMISKSHPFVGVQFEIPNTEQGSNGMCVLCLRKITTLLFYRTIQKGITVNTQIQRHGNICNQADEYHPSVMLICPPNGPVASMPLPIVAHQRNRYEVCLVHGVCYLKQVRVGMQDFQ